MDVAGRLLLYALECVHQLEREYEPVRGNW